MKRHELDWVSLIAGAVFLLVAVTHLIGAAAGNDPDLRWLLPAMLVGIGLAGLTGALRSSRPRPVPVGAAPIDHTSSDHTSSAGAPFDDAPSDDAPSDDAPSDDTVVLEDDRDGSDPR
jgi:hypothetical protein